MATRELKLVILLRENNGTGQLCHLINLMLILLLHLLVRMLDLKGAIVLRTGDRIQMNPVEAIGQHRQQQQVPRGQDTRPWLAKGKWLEMKKMHCSLNRLALTPNNIWRGTKNDLQ